VDIQTLGALGEFVGGIGGMIAALAVIASLVFVGMQIRASVRQAQVDSYSTVTQLWTNFTNATAASDEAWRIFYTGIREYDSLSPMEQSRFDFLIGMYFGIQDTVMVHEDLGVWKNPETYQRNLDTSYQMFLMPGVQSWWSKHQGRMFAPRVEQYVVSRARAEGKLTQ
jgi:hypothetical protein